MTSTNSQELQTTVRNQAILIQKLQEQLRGANAQIKVLKEMNRRTHPKKYGLPTLDKSTPRAYEDPFWKKGGWEREAIKRKALPSALGGSQPKLWCEGRGGTCVGSTRRNNPSRETNDIVVEDEIGPWITNR